MGASQSKTLAAAEAAVAAMRAVDDVIMPFPGGIVRSGSKVGSKYKGASASTNDAYCPTLKGAVDSALGAEIASVLEIVIDGLTSARRSPRRCAPGSPRLSSSVPNAAR